MLTSGVWDRCIPNSLLPSFYMHEFSALEILMGRPQLKKNDLSRYHITHHMLTLSISSTTYYSWSILIQVQWTGSLCLWRVWKPWYDAPQAWLIILLSIMLLQFYISAKKISLLSVLRPVGLMLTLRVEHHRERSPLRPHCIHINVGQQWLLKITV